MPIRVCATNDLTYYLISSLCAYLISVQCPVTIRPDRNIHRLGIRASFLKKKVTVVKRTLKRFFTSYVVMWRELSTINLQFGNHIYDEESEFY